MSGGGGVIMGTTTSDYQIVLEGVRTNQIVEANISCVLSEVDEVVEFAEALSTNTSVTCVGIRFRAISSEGVSALSRCLQQNTHLTSLDLRCTTLSEEKAVTLAEGLKKNKTLTRVDLFGNRDVDTGGIKAIVDAWKVNENLRELGLECTAMRTDDVRLVCDLLKTSKNLSNLRFGFNQMGENDCAKYLAEAIRDNNVLTHITLDGNDLGPEDTTLLFEAIKVNRSLKMVNYGQNRAELAGSVAIADALVCNETLTDLNVFENMIGEEGGKLIGNALKKNRTLKVLHIGFNSLHLGGVECIIEGLNWNQTLRELDISYNGFSINTSGSVVDDLQCNGSLTQCYCFNSDEIDALVARNKKMHEKARASVVALLCIRRYRQTYLNDNAKDVVAIIGRHLLSTKSDIETWNKM